MSVTIVVGNRHLLAGVSVAVLIAMAALALLVPSVSEATTTYTRYAICAGRMFYPITSNVGYWTNGNMRTHGYPNSTQQLECDPGLPHGAVVTSVSFTLWDNDPAAGIGGCALARSGLAATTVAGSAPQVIAATPGSTDAGTPGTFIKSGVPSAFATIDLHNFGYWLQCDLSISPNQYTGILGASVQYRITAAKG